MQSMPFAGTPLPLLLYASLFLAFAPAAGAALIQGEETDSVLSLSLEELMQITVTSASKKPQSLAQTAAAVFVISADDIRRAGATNVPEALRLAPGVQVAAIGHNKWGVSIRGFNSRFANKLLVLVDGRAVYSPSFSGVFWEHNDIPLENIERIEVIRGPGAAVWGANAVNGVINIITASAAATQGGLISAAAGDEVNGMGLVRYGWALNDDTHLRVYASGKSVDGGENAQTGGDGPDKWRNKQAGFRLDGSFGVNSISLQGALSDQAAGDDITAITPDPLAPVTRVHTDGDGTSGHLLGHWERPTTTGVQSLQAYFDHTDYDLGLARYRNDTGDLEYQRQHTGGRHDVVWGLGYRHSQDSADTTRYLSFRDSSKSYDLYSVFIQDEITLVPSRWRLTLGSRFEHNDFSGFEVQPNVRLLWTPTSRDSLWSAVSRAVRTPSRGELSATIFVQGPSVATGGLSVAAVGRQNMDSETLSAMDLGWRRQWSEGLSSELSAFYYRYADVRGSIPDPQNLQFDGVHPYIPAFISNSYDMETYGLELSLDWLPRDHWRLQANVALFDARLLNIKPGANSEEFIGNTPTSQISLRSSVDLTSTLQWDLWLRDVGERPGTSSPADDVAAYTTLDMRVAWKPRKDLDVAVVGQNLFEPSHQENVNLTLISTPIEIQRGFFLKADWQF